MKDAQKPDHISLTTLIGRLREGQYVIPDFQRDFEWQPWDISALMRSIFLDYYIGSLLLWKGKKENFEALACESVYGFEGDRTRPEYIVLDGQQRLTAMYYAFMAPEENAPKRANRFIYFIKVDQFIEESYDEAFHYDWTRRGENLMQNDESQYAQHLFPLSILGKTGWALPNWVQGYEKYWSDKLSKAKESNDEDLQTKADKYVGYAQIFGEHLRGITEQYQIAYIELDRDLPLDKVCDIFTQINSRGIRLDVFDLINALLRPKGLQLRYMWRDAEPRLNFVQSDRMNVYILQVMSVLRQAYCSPKYLYFLLPGQERQFRDKDGTFRKEVLVPDTDDFEERWSQAVDALENAMKRLQHPQEFGVISSKYLPYVSILPIFAALQVEIKNLNPAIKMVAQRKFRQWYWSSVFLNRYSGSVESTIARDYLDMKAWFNDDTSQPYLFTEFKERFRSIDLRRENRRGTSVYNGIFNLFVIKGARDWTTGNMTLHDELDDHHIVPKSWGRENSIGPSIDSILNRSPLTSETNRKVIHDQLPNSYLKKMIELNGRDEVEKILDSHFISPFALDILLREPFTKEDYELFLDERQKAIQEGIENLLIKARLDLSPKLRELDEKIERIELKLRSLISDLLENEPSKLPQHIYDNSAQRLQKSARKNPAIDLKDYENLISLLEYSDLRDLQGIITNKSLWPLFSEIFLNKEALDIKFNQLGELRNSIRHSRSVTEVVKKEGEAAVLWFYDLL